MFKKYLNNFMLVLLTFCICISIYEITNSTNVIKVNTKTTKLGNKVDVGKKVIYLTFDDGPSTKITPEILDILRENNVKGTFFLVGNKIEGREEVVKRIYEEGHSIGLHTYTHDYKKIYKNQENFIKEMFMCSDEIYRVVDIRPKIIRFPSGSCKHLNREFLNKLHSCGFKVFDWNMQLSDGINYRIPPEKLYIQGTKGSERFSNIVLLMHCDAPNKNTCKVLPKIIEYYKNNGYEFRCITEETPEKHFRIRK